MSGTATVIAQNQVGRDYDDFYLQLSHINSFDPAGTGTSATETDSGDNLEFVFTGTGLTYDAVTHELNGGTVTAISINDGSSHVSQIQYTFSPGFDASSLPTAIQQFQNSGGMVTTNLDTIFGAFNSNLFAGNGDDTFTGYGNNDDLKGAGGVDTLSGGAGDDTVTGGSGADILDGGAGLSDYINYFGGAAHGVTITLGAGGAQTTGHGGDAEGDLISNFENILATNFDDVLTGNELGNFIYAYSGNDTLLGMDGNDFLFPGQGADIVDGGAGIDDVIYDSSVLGVTITLGPGGAQTTAHGGDAEGDKISNIEVIQASDGGDDVLTGNELVNDFYGYHGNDTLKGGGGDDLLDGGYGADILDGGAGNDKAYYLDSDAGIALTLGANGAQTIVHGGLVAEGDKISNIETVDGSNFDDILTGNNLVNELFGNDGDDIIEGGGGIDFLIGGSGNNTLSYLHSSAAVTIEITGVNTGHGQGGDAQGDTYFGFENVIGSNFNDILSGDSVANTINGGGGNDTLSGGDGDDTIVGGAGNDVIEGGAGTLDTLDGGAGINTLSYAHSSTGVQVILEDIGPASAIFGDADGDVAINFQNITGSDSGDDLFGNSAANVLRGGIGDDQLHSGGGNDTLDGGDGDDYITAGAGVETIIGGAGDLDTLYYSDSTGGVTVVLGVNGAQAIGHGGAAEGDKISQVENVWGSDTAGDKLTGNNLANQLIGQGGDDFIEGGAGGDYLDGGVGIDTVSYAGSGAGVTITIDQTGTFGQGGDATGDNIVRFENIIGSTHDDILTGFTDNNSIDGGAGNDIIEGRGGTDILKGGLGTDTLAFTQSMAAVTVTLDGLNAASVSGGDAASETATGFENLIGSDNNDKLVGDGGANMIEGGLGDDNLDGGGNNDTVSYAHATDDVTVNLSVTTQQDTVHAGKDTLANFENILGSNWNDTLTGTGGINVINGGNGDDHLNGGGGADKISGGQGDDVVDGGAGKDVLDGGNGNEGNGDTVVYTTDTHGITATLGANGAATTVIGAAGSDAAGDVISNFENITGGSGADRLTGNALSNTIKGGMGDDFIAGNLGSDHLDGEGGTNTLSYAGNIAVTVDMAGGQTHTLANGDDFFTNFQSVIGSSKNDLMVGDTNGDRIDGGAGDDVIEGNVSDDILIGGAGNDTVSYQFATGAIHVDLTKVGVAQATVSGGSDTLSGFENVLGGDHGGTIIGDSKANILTGGGGFDGIIGGAGNDIIDGGGDDDSLDGGTGIDTVSYATAGADVTVNLSLAGMQQDTVGAGKDTLTGFENLTGSDHNDTLTGDAKANVLNGGAGIDLVSYFGSAAGVTVTLGKNGAATTGHGGDAQGDTIVNIEGVEGSAFNDKLTGNSSGSTLRGLGGNDFITGGAAPDTLDGGAGIDTISYAASTAGVTISLDQANQTTSGHGGDANGDSIENFEIAIGSAHNDDINLFFDSHVVKVDAGAGDDIVRDDNDDTILIGGAGIDTLNFEGASNSITVNLAVTAQQNTNEGGNDTISGFENIVGSNHGNTLTGTSGANTFTLGDGDDIVNGNGGNDTVSYSPAGFAVTIDLKQTGAQNTVGSGMDTLTGISNVIGSTNDDVLFGNAKANTISGTNGNDIIEGGGGADTLDGGAVNLFIDTVSYAGSAAGVTVKLGAGGAVATESGGDAQGDKISNFENITGSSHNDILTGNELANVIKGGDGDDVIQGGAGADTLDGENGINTLSYAGAATGVTVNFGLQSGMAQTSVGDDASGDILQNFRNIVGSSHNDLIIDAFASNKIDGGAGIDTLSYATFQDFVSVNLALGTAHENGGGDDTILNIENLIGSDLNDILTGNAGANNIQGGLGDDVIDGGAGNDIMGGGGFDTSGDTLSYASATAAVTFSLAITTAQVTGGAGTDTAADFQNLTGGNGVDHLTGDSGANIIVGGLGSDTIEGGAGADTLYGGVLTAAGQNDTVSYAHSSASVNVDLTHEGKGMVIPPSAQSGGDAAGDLLTGFANIIGSDHDDTLIGDSAVNKIQGGVGDDVIDGGAGGDTLDGGAGSDTLNYQFSANNVTIVLGEANVVTTGQGAAGSYAIGDKISNFEDIFGSSFNDTLTGNKGANTLIGFTGADKLSGGLGADLFAYNSAAEGGDTITDFVSGTDKIGISKAGFGGNLSSLGSTLDSTYFATGTADQAGHGQFIFDAATHNLYWDDDGTGGDAKMLLATFTNNAVLHATDFVLA